jgi:small-conductance mechanosensitive channel
MPGVSSAFSGIMDAMQDVFSSVLNKLLFAAIIIIVGFVVGRLLGNLVKHFLHEMGFDQLTRAAGIKLSIEGLLSSVVTYLTYFVAVVMALDKLGINTFVFNLIAGGMIAIVLLSVLLAIKDFIPNVFAGFFLNRRGIVKEGDRVRIDDVDGRVAKVDLMEVKLETKRGDTIFIPNSLVIRKKVIKKRR